MREFKEQLDYYATYWFSSFSKMTPEPEWGNTEIAASYLEKYWLPLREYEQKWKPIQDHIFLNQEEGLPKLVFAPEFQVLIAAGGCLFVQDDFARLQECVLAVGDQHLLIVENTFGGRLKEPMFRMKYPADISWEKLTGGNFVSSIILEMPHKEYFVFGESACWGKYSANDYETPLDVIGFKRAYEAVFRERFGLSEANEREIAMCLPPEWGRT